MILFYSNLLGLRIKHTFVCLYRQHGILVSFRVEREVIQVIHVCGSIDRIGLAQGELLGCEDYVGSDLALGVPRVIENVFDI